MRPGPVRFAEDSRPKSLRPTRFWRGLEMAAIYNGPARGGNRGGKDQFNWEDVKEDKNNQSYLGHSVKAPVGRWQNGVYKIV